MTDDRHTHAHCPAGHCMTGRNVRYEGPDRSWRRCRTCRRRQALARYHQARAAVQRAIRAMGVRA